MFRHPTPLALAISAILTVGTLAATGTAWAHCDTLDGPVVAAARRALESGDLTPVLKWIRPQHEAELRAVFDHALQVRVLGSEARQLADRHFFETLVRLHRAGEGAPYTGLKPAGTTVEPAVLAADEALETGSADALVRLVTADAEAGIRRRFDHTLEASRHAEDSVEAGRRFVEAYVELTHYVERLHADALGGAAGHDQAPAQAHEHP